MSDIDPKRVRRYDPFGSGHPAKDDYCTPVVAVSLWFAAAPVIGTVIGIVLSAIWFWPRG